MEYEEKGEAKARQATTGSEQAPERAGRPEEALENGRDKGVDGADAWCCILSLVAAHGVLVLLVGKAVTS